MKKLLFIINPMAGRQQAQSDLYKMVKIFADHDYEVTVYPTRARQDCTRKVLEDAGRFDLVVCCGGDGTLNEMVSGMMQRAREAFMRAMDCFREGNGQEALALRNCEDEALQNEMRIVQRLLELLRQEDGKRPDPQLVMHTLLVVRALTRIWRRSVNLAEQVYFMQHGQSLKHSGEKK